MTAGSLDGQVALVTGAGRGIGREIALGLAAEGMSLGLMGRSRDSLVDTLKACVRCGAKGVAVAAEASHPGAVREAVRTVERDLGPISLLVNSAGQVDRTGGPPWESDPNQWWQVVEQNLRGPFNLMRTVLPGMMDRRSGRVVNINCGSAGRPDDRYSAYAASKAALLKLSDGIAESLKAHGVLVLDISPDEDAVDRAVLRPARREAAELSDWASVPYLVAVLVDAARGRFDHLHGRFVHVGRDTFEVLLSRAREPQDR